MKAFHDPISIPAVISDSGGRAWRTDLEAARKIDPGEDACLVQWIVEAPWARPFWHSYVLTLIHLRPMADKPAAKFYLHGATHELNLYALNPDVRREPAVVGTAYPSLLHPINFAAQIIRRDDAAALASIEETVRDICAGTLSPDTDYMQMWAHRFGYNMLKDRAHGTA